MKIFLLLFILLTTPLLAKKVPVMVMIKHNIKNVDQIIFTLQGAIEEQLLQHNYTLIDKMAQQQALKEQAKQQNSPCYDEHCLVKTGKMLAAQKLLILNITRDQKQYLMKLNMIHLESGETTKSTAVKPQKVPRGSTPPTGLQRVKSC